MPMLCYNYLVDAHVVGRVRVRHHGAVLGPPLFVFRQQVVDGRHGLQQAALVNEGNQHHSLPVLPDIAVLERPEASTAVLAV